MTVTIQASPPPPNPVDQGGTYAYSLSRDTPNLGGKLTDLLRTFPHNIHPLSRELFTPLDPLSQEILFFFGLGKYMCNMYFTSTLRGPFHKYAIIVALPPFLREAIEESGIQFNSIQFQKHVHVYTYKIVPLFSKFFGKLLKFPISRESGKKKQAISGFLGIFSLRQIAKIPTFSRKWEYECGPLVHSTRGGGGYNHLDQKRNYCDMHGFE